MDFEKTIRNMIAEEVSKRDQPINLAPIDKFCEDTGLSRTSVWRGRKKGDLKTITIGGRVFIDMSQFAKK